MPRYCTRCGAQNRADVRYCQHCGAPMVAQPGTVLGQVRALPQTFVLGVVIGVMALLGASGIEVMRLVAAPGPQPSPTAPAQTTGTPVALATTIRAPSAQPTPGDNTPVATADSGPTDTPDADGPHVVIIEDSIQFDDTTPGSTSAAKTVTLSNEGGAAQPLGTPTFDGTNPDAFAVSTNDCFDSLDSLGQCTLEVTFTPPAAGAFSATLEIVDPQGNSVTSVDVSGNGGSSNSAADISISPGTLELDTTAGSSASGSIEIDNNGTAAIGVSESVDDGGVFTVDGSCNTTIDADSTCYESVEINPPDQCDSASYSGSVSFSDDAGNDLGSTALSSSVTGDSSQCPTPDTGGDKAGGSTRARPGATPSQTAALRKR